MTDQMHTWFGVHKPIIAVAHFPALPGAPRYDPGLDAEAVLERMAKDVRVLLDGGCDAFAPLAVAIATGASDHSWEV